jgi:hypothetical protein
MGLFEYMYPNVTAQQNARSLSAMVRGNVQRSRRTSRKFDELFDRVGALEDDLDFLSLVVMSLFSALNEKGIVTPAEVLARLAPMDRMDGAKDGAISPAALRKAFGFSEPEEPQKQ